MEKLASSKEDDKTKETKQKQIEQQIKTIEAQIARESNRSASTANSDAAASPAKPPTNDNILRVANANDIATATTNSEGRFDIRI
ncbi:hypothetical protein J2T20_000686 [Paenibacillus wynnii]|nr:hypothetical protein [Paenibacillus wynnii]